MDEFYYKEKEFTFKKVSINVLLFITTFLTVTLAGVAWSNMDPYQLENFPKGLPYSILLMLMITSHEFGHYFAARAHKIKVTLPYYIPFPFLMLNPFGTMGAVIRMKSPTQDKKSLFDVGVAGPLAGWFVTIAILVYGYTHLPSIEYLYNIHPEYREGGILTSGLYFGNNLIFLIGNKLTALLSSKAFVPPMNEIYHYPFLCVGWFGLLITSLNLMPVGQLDGGHISYAMFGNKHKYVAYIVFALLMIFGVLGILTYIFPNLLIGSTNWLVWGLLLYFVIKIKHPPILTDENSSLDAKRTFLGWFAFLIFAISFCPIPIYEL
ncbi:MAG TPA: site-2 protease family protein [Ignavibacteria bacterium]|nr:site-2 protease family protein [Ignavibacteria bacterium]